MKDKITLCFYLRLIVNYVCMYQMPNICFIDMIRGQS